MPVQMDRINPAAVNNIYYVDGKHFTTIQAAITQAGTTGAVIIPPNYAGVDTYTNPNSIVILDYRHGVLVAPGFSGPLTLGYGTGADTVVQAGINGLKISGINSTSGGLQVYTGQLGVTAIEKLRIDPSDGSIKQSILALAPLSAGAFSAADVSISRTGAGVAALGNGSQGDTTGRLQLQGLTVGGDTTFTAAPRMIWGSYQGGTLTVWTYSNPLASIVLDKAITVTRFSVTTGGAVTAATVAPTVTVTDNTNSVTLTFNNGSGGFVPLDSGAVSVNFPAGATLRITETAGTCTTPPSINNIAVEYKMQ